MSRSARRAQELNDQQPSEGVDATVGQRIRLLRKERGLSLTTVAATTGLSIGYLSQIERGLSSTSLRALTSLADALRVSTADLIQGSPRSRTEAASMVTRRGERPKLKMWKSGIQKLIIAGGAHSPSAPFSFILLQFEAGASSGEERYTHYGEEAGYVLEGRLRLSVGDDTWALNVGDSFHFPSTLPHRFENGAKKRTVVVMINLHQTPF